MELAIITAYKIFTMFIMLAIGALCYKKGILDRAANEKLSQFLLMIISPFLVLVSYQREYDASQLHGLLIAIALSVLSHIAGIIVAAVFVKKGKMDFEVERMAVVYSNCGFMGIPLINGILGAEGVFYITAYITVFNVFAWTHGVILMSGKQSVKDALKALCTPTLIAIVIGLIFYINRISIPSIILDPVKSIADMNTPVAMLIAGVSLASSDLIKTIQKKRIYYLSFARLIVVPILFMIILPFINASPEVKTAILIATSCPTASMGIMFALRYNKNSIYISEIFGICTLLSLITIPLMVLVYNYIPV